MADRRPNEITGVILAGGRGQRLGGGDKGLQLFHGKPLLVHVIERLQPQVSLLMINANRNRESYAAFGHPVIADIVAGYAGPLAGLHAALSATTTESVLAVPCDAPLLPRDLATRLFAAMSNGTAPIAVARVGMKLQPTFCLVRRSTLENLEGFLNAGGRKMGAWQQSLNASCVDFDDQPEAFHNINSPEDLAALE